MTKTCRACGRALTDPASREREVGPVCAAKAHGTPIRRRQRSLPEDEPLTGFPEISRTTTKGTRR